MLHIGGRSVNASELVLDTTIPLSLVRQSKQLSTPKKSFDWSQRRTSLDRLDAQIARLKEEIRRDEAAIKREEEIEALEKDIMAIIAIEPDLKDLIN